MLGRSLFPLRQVFISTLSRVPSYCIPRAVIEQTSFIFLDLFQLSILLLTVILAVILTTHYYHHRTITFFTPKHSLLPRTPILSILFLSGSNTFLIHTTTVDRQLR